MNMYPVLSYGYKRLCLREIELLIRFSDVMILGRMRSVRNTNEGEYHDASVQTVHAAYHHLASYFIVQN
jgi:hypothetical protein